jgi:hypothetical protein
MKPKIFIATPMYGGQCFAVYLDTLLKNQQDLVANGIKTCLGVVGNESLIPRARDRLVHEFLKTDSTHLLFIDADIQAPADAVRKLLLANEDIVCGSYCRKEIVWSRVVEAVKAGAEDPWNFAGNFAINTHNSEEGSEVNADGLLRVRHAGTGFMLIKREVFETLKDNVPHYRATDATNPDGSYIEELWGEYFGMSITETGVRLSEDYHFCSLWDKAGGKIYIDTSIQLGHVGTHTYTADVIKSNFRFVDLNPEPPVEVETPVVEDRFEIR